MSLPLESKLLHCLSLLFTLFNTVVTIAWCQTSSSHFISNIWSPASEAPGTCLMSTSSLAKAPTTSRCSVLESAGSLDFLVLSRLGASLASMLGRSGGSRSKDRFRSSASGNLDHQLDQHRHHHHCPGHHSYDQNTQGQSGGWNHSYIPPHLLPLRPP